MSAPNATNVEEVLPNDEDLGRRNCRWRELIKKYEEGFTKEVAHNMDIDTAMDILDQDMSNESSVSDVEETSSRNDSVEENPEEIKRQLQVAIPSRKRAWEVNGLKEIMDDQEFRMLSHEKVENWLRNHMDSITGHYNVHYQTQQVTTVTETCMDADADSLYSVDTAQYIRSNKQISNKVKVTTMIKQYAVTSSIRHGRLNSLGNEHPAIGGHRLSLPQLGRQHSKSEASCDVKKLISASRQVVASEHLRHHEHPPPTMTRSSDPTRRTRKKVFKKTLPRKRSSAPAGDVVPVNSPPLRYDQRDAYERALEQCARIKKAKVIRRTPARKVTRRYANRGYSSRSSSGDGDERLDDSDEVFRGGPSRERPTATIRQNLFQQATGDPTTTSPPTAYGGPQAAALETTPPSSAKTSPTEREIVEPFQSITLSSITKRKRSNPAGPVQRASGDSLATLAHAQQRPRKRVGIQADGCYHDEGLVIFRPKTIQPHLPTSERIVLRMEDLTLDGVRKERHMAKFRDFNYRIHPNSTVCFYPSDSDCDEEPEQPAGSSRMGSAVDNSETDNSFEDDPILSFHPRKTKLLNVVEVPYRRPIS